ncbi:ABC transporter permease subunit [Kitasatospora sp. NPDC057198]|uniref:ABC transporter permease subunit n=1 Tax=Kitasatospora sp. NPDC057198 TaxID=3346046 RepID=UPI003637D29D
MTWLTWRQYRTQFLAAALALAATAGYLFHFGGPARERARGVLTGPSVVSEAPFQTVNALVLLAPALIGAFWGAPMIARELETGTHRLIWNQSVTRHRWLTIRLLTVAAAALTATGLLSLFVTWYAGPVDQRADDPFRATTFAARGVVPVGYTAFALALGVCLGLFVRRTVPAMAATLLLFAAVQVLVPLAVRPHLMAPVRAEAAVTGVQLYRAHKMTLGGPDDAPVRAAVHAPHAWNLVDEQPVLTSTGQTVTRATAPCRQEAADGLPQLDPCAAEANLHVSLAYHPNSRYWAFQWIETALYLVLAAALTALTRWGLRRRLG